MTDYSLPVNERDIKRAKTFYDLVCWGGLLIVLLPVGIANIILGYLLGDSPCTLCWAQRQEMAYIGVIALMMVRYGFKPKYLIASICGALFIGALALCERLLINGKSLPFNVWTAILGGGLISVGTVIPGVSTSFILIFLGLYKPMLSCFNTFVDFKLIFTMLSGDAAARDAWLNSFLMLLFVALGLAVVALALILFVRRLFNKHHEYAHYAVLGFLITSAILIFPGFERSFMQLIYTALLAGGFFIAYFIDRFIANGE